MEAVLYDLYIAEAEMAGNHSIFSGDSARKAELLNDVLKRNGVSRAELDSSLVWFSDNLDAYQKINEKIKTRLEAEIEVKRAEQTAIQATLDEAAAAATRINLSATTFLLTADWMGVPVATFRADSLPEAEADTVLTLSCNITFLTSPKAAPTITFSAIASDTVYTKNDTIRSDGHFLTTLDIQPAAKIESIRGAFAMPEKSADAVIVSGLKLSRAKQLPRDSNLIFLPK